MPRAKKETPAEIQQRTMEEMQAQIAQLTQALQGLLAQRNTPDTVAGDDDEEQSDHDRDANPFAVLEETSRELLSHNPRNAGIGVSNLRFQNFMEIK
ncbi:hypothetical protein Bca4012_036321 [Brassica carinata]|uniref:Uncharacterized protein n=1 Tax=Brassica carinata TaxID=52824 RepID=A0A8X7WDT6_BRACI|nr:hypothetical protein Bca52824_010048 [Brassica carinata]